MEQAERIARQKDGMRLYWDRQRNKDKRIRELEAALREIAEGKWTESGDAQGAAYSELRAMHIASKALRED